MKKSLKLKLLFDGILTVIWVILMIYSLTGAFWHELLGITIFALFAIHVGVNHKWISVISKKLFTSKLNLNTVKYILDFLLLIAITLTTISGVLISKKILTVFTTDDFAFWSFIHSLSAYGSLAIISVHIGLHWKMIFGMFRKFFGLREVKRVRSVVCKLFSVAIILLGFKSSVSYELPTYSSGDDDDDEYTLDAVDGMSTVTATGQSITTATTLAQTTDTKTSVTTIAATPNDGETLEDYLNRLICTACHNRCSLLSPRCSRGEEQADAAEVYYNAYNAENTSDIESSSAEEESSTTIEESQTTSETEASDSSVNSSTVIESGTEESSEATITTSVDNEEEASEEETITSSANSSDDESSSVTQTLEEYLGSLFCNACGRHCSLLNPQCNVGEEKAEEAEEEFYATQDTATSENTGTESTVKKDDETSSDKTNVGDIMAIMGMYIGSTYYIVSFLEKKKKM